MDEFRRKPTPWTTRPKLTNKLAAEAPPPTQMAEAAEDDFKVIPPFPTQAKQAVFAHLLPKNTTSQNTPVAVAGTASKPGRRKAWLIGFTLGSMLIAILGAGAVTYYIKNRPSVPFSSAITNQVSFPLYYSSKIPNGFTFKASDISVKGNVVTLYYTYGGNKKLIINEQAKPLSFDFSQITGDSAFQTSYGNAVIKVNDTNTTASLVTSKTWLLLNSTGTIATKDVEELLNNLTQADPPKAAN
jgi:hypothetical protein